MTKMLLAAALALAGVAAAVLVASPTARAWDIHSLPAGYSTLHTLNTSALSCHESYTIQGYGASTRLCTDAPDFQDSLDAFIASTCPTAVCPPPQTTDAATEAPTTSGTDQATTPAAPATSPQATTSDAAVTETTETTIATTTVDELAELQRQIDELRSMIATLTDRVERIARAVDAAWLAYQQQAELHADSRTAADVARATYLNAIYGLGDFAR